MPSNLTVDDFSPIIQYNGQWLDSSNLTRAQDPFASRYRDGTFHSSQTNGSTATISFKGTEVYIFGAKRGNHGYYSVLVDEGEPERFDGYAPQQPDGTDGVYQVPLFVRTGMADTNHTIVLTNIVNGNRPFVDIDYITWTRSSDPSYDSRIIEDPRFEYSGPSEVWTAATNKNGYRSSTAHSTTTFNAAAALNFEGSEILLYGGTGPNHGMYNVQLDGQPEATFNGTSPIVHTQTLLYAASDIGPGGHRITITNTEEGKVLDVDYAEIVPHSGISGLTSGAIAGMVVGIVAGLALLSFAAWFFFVKRRRAKRRYSTDLVGGGSGDSQAAVMGSYSAGHNPMVVEPFTDQPEGSSTSGVATTVADGSENRAGGRKGAGPGVYVNRPERSGGSTQAGSASASRSNIEHETDAGALPPVYDEIVPSKVADVPIRNGL